MRFAQLGGIGAATRALVALALVAGYVAVGAADSATAAFAAGRCILCNAFGANQAPRICNSCNNKFNNRCILCNAFGANQAPRICNSCNNKFNNRCVLCNAFGANSLPRICNSCNNKF
jgi:hypothetical protein